LTTTNTNYNEAARKVSISQLSKENYNNAHVGSTAAQDVVIPVRVELTGQGKQLATSIGKATRISRALINNGASHSVPQHSSAATTDTVLPQIHNSVVVVADNHNLHHHHHMEMSTAGRTSHLK